MVRFSSLVAVGLVGMASVSGLRCRSAKGQLPIPTPPTGNPPSGIGGFQLGGITYSPYGASSQCLSRNVIGNQVRNIAKHTKFIRTYGADCNQLEVIFNLIADSRLDLKVLVGIWIRDGEPRFQQELAALTNIVNQPRFLPIIDEVTVGNEELFNGHSESYITGYMDRVRSVVASRGISVSTVEVGHLWTESLIARSARINANMYPFYSQAPPDGDNSIARAIDYAELNIRELQAKNPAGKPLVITETGWASSGTAPVLFNAANVPNMMAYTLGFRCLAQRLNLRAFHLEAYDAGWKHRGLTSSVETRFGLFDVTTNDFKFHELLAASPRASAC